MRLSIVGLTAFFVLTASLAPSAWADYKAADEAFKARNWSGIVKACRQDAEAGEKNCQRHMGYLYKTGYGVERDLPKSVELLRKCAAQEEMYCLEMLGDSLKNGLGVKTDYAEALRLIRLSAARGNPWAYNNLGEMYRAGQGVGKDPAEAVKNFQIAADKGNGLGQARLADMYRLGEGVEKNADMAFQLALKSSKQNYGVGWNMMGLLYRDGIGVRQDTPLAIEAFKKALDPQIAYRSHIAYANLAQIYYQGKIAPLNWDEAAKWAEEGARLKQRDSMTVLSSILAQGTKTLPANPERAFKLAKEAYDLGSIYAADNLGWFYRDGIGTPKDLKTAIRYLSEAQEKGVIGAYVSLGQLYLDGQGVAKDTAKAQEYFMIAKAQIDRLGPGKRKFIESYFAADTSNQNQQQGTGGSKTPSGNQAQPIDSTQQALLDRLEKMQKQLESLQASANTINHAQVVSVPAQMAVRRALVIGNDKYQHVPQLINARRDATAIASSLSQLGYSVSQHHDLTEKGFKQALREFRSSIDGGEEVLFFFAGHGVQLGSTNYLLPTDTKGDNEEQVKDEAIELQRVLDDLKSRNAKFALAIVDACRDNPFKQSGRAIGGRGLAPTTAATGQMVMFSAGAGQQALDNLGASDHDKNGLFTRVLLKEMKKPGVPVDRVLRNVRNEVVRLSKSVGHEQTPALYDQAVGDFYFAVK